MILDDLEQKGLFLSSGDFNASFSKTFLKRASESEKKWYETSPGASLSEKVYLITHKLSKIPVCSVCGNPVKFISYKEGYRSFCSNKCRANGVLEARQQTCLQKYGAKHPAQNEAIKQKTKKTNIEKYGVDNIFKNKEYIRQRTFEKLGVENASKLKPVIEKTKATNLSRYGVSNPNRSPEILKKRSETNLQKYGNVCSIHGAIVWEKVSQTKRKNFWALLSSNPAIQKLVTFSFSFSDYKGTQDAAGNPIQYPWACKVCGSSFLDYLANGHIPRCPVCHPIGSQGILEKELADWVASILPNEQILYNTRKIIPPKELDIYIPNRKLAIEFDELFWHAESASKGSRGKQYHLQKTVDCEALGITLLHIYESEWLDRQDEVKAMITSKLGIYSKTIFARKCEVKKVPQAISSSFLEDNHMQGAVNCSLRYGLFYQDELVAFLGLGKNRFRANVYELTRFVVKRGYHIPGALSKLWVHCMQEHSEISTVYSYSDRRYFSGKSVTHLGFSFLQYNEPGFYYTKDYKVLENRLKYQKHKLAKLLPVFDPALTEWENMQLNGYDRIWDCGTSVWEWNRS